MEIDILILFTHLNSQSLAIFLQEILVNDCINLQAFFYFVLL